MAFDSFRDFISVLEKAGELKRITQPIATALEITELADREMKSPAGGKALLIDKPTVNGQISPFPLAINSMGSWKRMAASMGAFLLAAGTKGKRFALPNSTVLIHQPLGGFQGQASDIAIHAKYILSLRERLNRLLAQHVGKPVEQIERDTDRDNFLTAEEALQYGLIDKVLQSRAQGL